MVLLLCATKLLWRVRTQELYYIKYDEYEL
jgi:hypothetical protein